MTIEELFIKGGIVVWILAGYSVLALAITLERIFYFVTLGRPPRDLHDELKSAADVEKAASAVGSTRGPEGAIVQALLQAAESRVEDLSSVASRVGTEQLRRMERGFRTLGVLGNTAPLLGLFGTILGMIKAFMVIEQAGGRVDAQALAGGIWEAMVTTGVGLAVSIPILLLLHFLEGAADRRAH